MTETQETKLRMAFAIYESRLIQTRMDLAGHLRTIKRQVDKDAKRLPKRLRDESMGQAAEIEGLASLLITEEPDLGFDKDMFLSELLDGKESLYG